MYSGPLASPLYALPSTPNTPVRTEFNTARTWEAAKWARPPPSRGSTMDGDKGRASSRHHHHLASHAPSRRKPTSRGSARALSSIERGVHAWARARDAQIMPSLRKQGQQRAGGWDRERDETRQGWTHRRHQKAKRSEKGSEDNAFALPALPYIKFRRPARHGR